MQNEYKSFLDQLAKGLNEATAVAAPKIDGSKEIADAVKKMADDINRGQGGPVSTGTPKKISRILASITFEDPYLAIFFSRKNTDYWEDNSSSTAGVAVQAGRIQFYYNTQFLNSLSDGEMIFLLKHELFHILRRHQSRGQKIGAVGDKHTAMNIAADSIINRDLLHDRSLTTTRPIPIKGGIFLHKSDISGDYNYVDVMAKKEYKGKPITEPITNFLWDNYEQQEQEPKVGDDKGNKRPYTPHVGSVIYNEKTDEYGVITKISGQDIDYDVITEEEAKSRLSKRSSLIRF